jgi:serine/threonine protein kinase
MGKPSSRKIPLLARDPAEAPPSGLGQAQPAANASAPETVSYLAGEVIGDRYRLVREVGRGGMGVVWVAHSLVLGVDVAVKLIRASGGSSTTSRMAREAHAAARLGHPALVRVFDFGWTNRGDPFLVMELVQGETLSAMLERETRIGAIRAVQMLLPIADGLRLAHGKSIVHRDIKPENIFLAKDALGRTQPKLIDFGIAKVGANNYDGKLTQVGVVLGSPEYMSPEQALGADDVDERTDVWSLSVVLYELVTGTIPFRRPNYNALMRVIINDPPKPMTECDAGDAGLWQVVERGLAKSRDDRWPNMTEFGEALALWLYEHGIKEDLSGNSIRAVWLDAALSGMRVELDSSVAPGSIGDRARSSPGIVRLGVTTHGESTRLTDAVLGRSLSPTKRTAVVLAIGVGLGAGGITAATLLSRGTASSPAAPKASAAVLTPKEALPTAGVPAKESSAVPAPRASSAAPAETEAPAVPKPETNAPRASSAKPSAKPASRRPRRSHDFGF